ncbi:MAG TPA: carboxypeptidase-like regulatory domain-containing protein [Pyrinomonadaceae bacterium]|nr:carboxypeptidase-like regulatory domain-containing protein [Pyrinomonadaceae bacterium]
MAREKTLNLKNVASGIESGIETADAERAKALGHLQVVRNAKAGSLKREHERLAAKYGAQHPRVLELDARVKLNDGLLSNLGTEIVRAKTEIPRVDETGWVLHGFVRDLNGKGLPQLTVAPYDRPDRTGNWARELGYDCTNDLGYFKIAVKNLKEGNRGSVFLRVLNKQGATLFCDPQVNTPRPGGLDYREIRITGDVVECAPPPPPPKDPAVAEWIVTGRVVDANNNAVPGVTVSLSDKEEVFASRLGTTETDPAGSFTFRYNADQFKDLAAKNPELFVQVTAGGLRQNIDNPKALRFEAGKTEKVTVAVKAQTEPQKPWVVKGTVSEPTGAPAPKLIVTLADREGKFADRLGKTRTNAKGEFEFTLQAEQFTDVIAAKVDLFVQVLDANQKLLFTSAALRFEPGKTETLAIALRR